VPDPKLALPVRRELRGGKHCVVDANGRAVKGSGSFDDPRGANELVATINKSWRQARAERRSKGAPEVTEALFNPVQHPRGRGGTFVEKALKQGRVVGSMTTGTKSSFGGNLHRITLQGDPGSELSFDRRQNGIWHHTFTSGMGGTQFVNPSVPLSGEQSQKLDAIDHQAALGDIAALEKAATAHDNYAKAHGSSYNQARARLEVMKKHVAGGYFTGPSALKGRANEAVEGNIGWLGLASMSPDQAKGLGFKTGKLKKHGKHHHGHHHAFEAALEEMAVSLPYRGSPLHLNFNPAKHPRGRLGKFVDVLGKLERSEHGSTVKLPHGITLRRDLRGIAVKGGGGGEVELGTRHAAAAEALYRHDMHHTENPTPEGHARLLDELEAARRASATSDMGDVELLGKRQNAVRLSARKSRQRFLSGLSPEMFKPGKGGGRVFAQGATPHVEKVLADIQGRANMAVGRHDYGDEVGHDDLVPGKEYVPWDPFGDRPLGAPFHVEGHDEDGSVWVSGDEAEGFMRPSGASYREFHRGGAGRQNQPTTSPVSYGFSKKLNGLEKGDHVTHPDEGRGVVSFVGGLPYTDELGMMVKYDSGAERTYPWNDYRTKKVTKVAGRANEPVPGQTMLFDKSVLPSPGVRRWNEDVDAPDPLARPGSRLDYAIDRHRFDHGFQGKLARAADRLPSGRKNEPSDVEYDKLRAGQTYVPVKDGVPIDDPFTMTERGTIKGYVFAHDPVFGHFRLDPAEGVTYRPVDGRKNEAVGETPAWMKKPMTSAHMLAMVNAGATVSATQWGAGLEGGLAGMLHAGSIVRPEHAAALEKAGYWPKQKKR
jgi:hypothetical protein